MLKTVKSPQELPPSSLPVNKDPPCPLCCTVHDRDSYASAQATSKPSATHVGTRLMSTAVAMPALDNTFGAFFLGVVLAMGLWGAGSVQLYYYFNQYPKDDPKLKALVTLVWVMDTIHQGLIIHSAYTYLITHYGDPAELAVVTRSLMTMILFNSLISGTVQAFFVYRVWRMSRQNIPLTVFLAMLSAGQCFSILAYYIKAFHLTLYAQLTNLFTLEKVLNVFGAVSDFAIAGSLIFYLHRSRTGFKRSESMVNRLIIFSINTGAVTSVCAIMALIFVSVFPQTFLYITFYLLISRMYTNSLLATLNARSSIAGKGGSGSEESGAMNSFHLTRIRGQVGDNINDAPSSMFSKMSQSRALTIKIDTETRHDDDTLKISPIEGDSGNSISHSASGFPSFEKRATAV